MSAQEEPSDLESVRHDLKNVLDSLHHGCTLIGSKLGREHDEVQALLEEMLRCVDRGSSLVERLRRVDPAANQPTRGSSEASSRGAGEP